MTQSGKVDYDQVARAQALLLRRHRLSPAALVSAYRTVRAAMPGTYTEQFVKALLAQGRALGGEPGFALMEEAVDLARLTAEDRPRNLNVLVDALGDLQHALYDAGRRDEGLAACQEMASVGMRAPEFHSPLTLAGRLAEEGRHEESAELFETIVSHERRIRSTNDFWMRIAWIAELEAAGQYGPARNALRALIDDERQRAEQHTHAFAIVIWELLLLAAMDREHGREPDAEGCDQEIEALLTRLAADGEPKNWSNIMGWWVVLIGLTGRSQDRPQPGYPEPPLFLSLHWSPDLRRDYVGPGRDRLESDVARLAALADRDPAAHLRDLIETQRKFTLRSVRSDRHWSVSAPLRQCFDGAVDSARLAIAIDEPLGRFALARALTDRASMHIAARDFPPALDDFQRARRVAAGGSAD